MEMSIEVMKIVWKRYPEGGSKLLVLLALADWANDAGICFPSMPTIASKIRLSKSQAQRVLHDLIEQEFICVLGNAKGGRPGATPTYRINIEKLTDITGATGSVDATGRMDASPTGRMDTADGSHRCGETGRVGATQTVIEPSVTTKRDAQAASTPPKPARPKREEVTLTEYLAGCKATGVKPIPGDHPMHESCADSGITTEMLQLAWLQFKRRYTTEAESKGKRYKDWPGVFSNAVKGRWGVVKLWHFGGESGTAEWTSDGMAFKRAEEARLHREAQHA